MKARVGDLREQAAKVLSLCTLRDVRLLSTSCGSINPIPAGPFTVTPEIQVKGNDSPEEETLFVFARYELRATISDDPDIEAWSVRLEHVASYERDTDQVFTDEEAAAFALMVGVTHVHPYAREAVQSLVSRMGYPPFTLDALEPLSALPPGRGLRALEP